MAKIKLMLQGNEGYYCKRIPIEFDGAQTLWRIRELPDDLADRVEEAPMKMLEELKQFGLDPHLAAQAASGDLETRRGAINTMMDDLLASALTDNRLAAAIRRMRHNDEDLVIETVAAGLLDFPEEVRDTNADGQEFTPEVSEGTVRKLPRTIRHELARAIREESGLKESEADFLERSLPR